MRAFLLALLVTAAACHGESAPPGAVEVIEAPPDGDVAAWIAGQRAAGRDVVVYAGASWCEPCQHFHEAVAAHQLDTRFPRLRLLEFDWDRDEDRLAAAGYMTELLPLFAIPGADGRAAGPQISGSIKGDGAVEQIAPRLAALIAGAPR